MFRILIVDDNEIIRSGLKKTLSRVVGERCEFYEADCGEQAVSMAKVACFNVVFCDIQMKELSGLDVVENIKQHSESTRFVIISGHSDFEYTKQAIKLGVTDYLLKPFKREEIETLIKKILEDISNESTYLSFENLYVDDCLTNDEDANCKIINFTIDYINNNYQRDLSLAYMSNLVSKNYNYFSTLFKNHTGFTFTEYLRNVRIEKAKELLKDMNNKAIDVYTQVGFLDYNHFCKTFTKVVGMSPGVYKSRFMQ